MNATVKDVMTTHVVAMHDRLSYPRDERPTPAVGPLF
jgi:hypothetical protein